jgi:purine catabolism regulator
MQTIVGVKVKEALDLDVLKGAQILCGHEGLDNYISKVNVMEVPDIVDWIKPGEFLLTTAYSIKDDILKLNDLIPRMKEIGVSGLGIKMKRYVDALPQIILDTANQHQFPIINIPLELSFGDIISAVLTTVVNKQMSLLVEINDFNSRLKEIMLKGGEIEDIAKMIGETVQAPVAVVDEIFKDYVIISSDLYKEALTSILDSFMFKKTGKSKYAKGKSGIELDEDLVEGHTIKRLMIPIYSGGVSYGYVIIWDIGGNIPNSTLMMIEAATSLIALNSSKKLSVYENENKHKIDFIEELLSDSEMQHQRAVEKASYFNFNIMHSYGVLLVALDESYTDVVRTPNNTVMLKQLNSKLISVVERLHRFYKDEMIYGNKSDRIVFLVGFERQMSPDAKKQAMIKLAGDLLDFARLENIHNKISIGLGRVYDDYRSLHRSYREAQQSIHQLSISKNQNHIFHFDDLGIYKILSNKEIYPDVHQFFGEVLGEIVRYDRDKDAELLKTLQMYYKHGCNLKKVSEEMYTHYNTIIYRMQRIKEVGGIDFNDPDASLNIHIALKILDIINLDNLEF